MKYSKSTGNFYPDDIVYSSLPSDLIDVTDAEYAAAMARELGATLDVVKGRLKIIPPTAPTMDDLRAAKLVEISVWRDRQENGFLIFEHADYRWDGGKAVRERMQPAISAMQVVGDIPGFIWTTADNEDVAMTLKDLLSLAAAHDVAMVMQGAQIHARQRQMKEVVATMSAEQLAAFVPGWGDENAQQP